MRKAFTLIELLVVIAIIAILAAILFPVFVQAKLAPKKTKPLSNVRNLGTAFQIYVGDNDEVDATAHDLGNRALIGLSGDVQTCVENRLIDHAAISQSSPAYSEMRLGTIPPAAWSTRPSPSTFRPSSHSCASGSNENSNFDPDSSHKHSCSWPLRSTGTPENLSTIFATAFGLALDKSRRSKRKPWSKRFLKAHRILRDVYGANFAIAVDLAFGVCTQPTQQPTDHLFGSEYGLTFYARQIQIPDTEQYWVLVGHWRGESVLVDVLIRRGEDNWYSVLPIGTQPTPLQAVEDWHGDQNILQKILAWFRHGWKRTA